MAESNSMQDSLLDMFVFECNQLNEQLVEHLLNSEKNKTLSSEEINEIFRIMHTIKGSSALMNFAGISKVAHGVEDLFFFIRENKPEHLKYDTLCDIVLSASDYLKAKLEIIEAGGTPEDDFEQILERIGCHLSELKSEDNSSSGGFGREQKVYGKAEPVQETVNLKDYIIKVYFEDGWQMENVRAYSVTDKIKDICAKITYTPQNLLEDNTTAEIIVAKGFTINASCNLEQSELEKIILEMPSVRSVVISIDTPGIADKVPIEQADFNLNKVVPKNSMMSVSTVKLDKLMNLVGEIVISESMVIRNPDLQGLELESFNKSAEQLKKLTDELQDAVMSVRMVSVAGIFAKMNRIVRDMNKKLGKDVQLEIIGQDTEVDKNIIDRLSDPLMHIVRNAIDHGIESEDERTQTGKSPNGNITLEAGNVGSEIIIKVMDDGCGLNREKILKKARENGFITKRESDLTDQEILNFVLQPGFSTNENVTEFSGRGVGLDVVKKSIEELGGTVLLASIEGKGTTVTLKIPLTLAIIEGMEIAVGSSRFSIPIDSMIETLRPSAENIYRYPDGHDMIQLRGNFIPVINLYELFLVPDAVNDYTKGIILVVERDKKSICLFADEILGEQQVVVKSIPPYLSKYDIKDKCGISGCTILGNGNISLILDVSKLLSNI